MPKATKKSLNPSASKATSNAEAGPSTPKLYSGFLPIPISLPSPLPIPIAGSSKKPLTSVTHYIYVRAYSSKSKSPSTTAVDSRDPERTAFVINLPVDFGERDLRGLFGRWGVISSIEIGGMEKDVLESAVSGISPKDLEEDSDEDSEEGEDEGEEEEQHSGQKDLQFLGDGQSSKKSRAARRRLNNSLSAAPTVKSLPPTNPRATPFGASGSRTAHITYVDPLPRSRLLSYTGAPIPHVPSEPSGLAYYIAQHGALRPGLLRVKDYADSSMARFDHLHSLLLSSRARQAGAGGLVDEDGWTVVVRGTRSGRTGAIEGTGATRVGIAGRGFAKVAADKKKGKGASELLDFYKFQKTDRKKQELADLRTKFEEDKRKVEEMKRSKRFKPY